jgi:hypothetical protein
MTKLLLVAVGGALGSVARYLVGVQALRLFGSNWPYGTFIVNLTGGLLMGCWPPGWPCGAARNKNTGGSCSVSASWAASPPFRPFRWRPR